MNKKLLVPVLIVTAVFLGTWTYIKAEDEQITVCVKKSGLVYVIGEDFRRTECKKNDSLLSWVNVGPQGPKGEKGDIGEQGIQGLAGIVDDTIIVSNSATGGSWDTVTTEAVCPSDKILLSGGAKVTSGIASRAFIKASYPIGPSTWRATATALDQGADFVTITAYAICSK